MSTAELDTDCDLVDLSGPNPLNEEIFAGPSYANPDGETKTQVLYSRLRDVADEKDYRVKALEFAILTEDRLSTALSAKPDDRPTQEPWQDVVDIADKYLRWIKGEPEHDLKRLFPEAKWDETQA